MRSLLVACLLAPSTAWASCTMADVSVAGISVRPDVAPYARVVGEIVNACPDPARVQLEIVIRNPDGSVFDVRRLWPASTRAINARSTFPFSILVDAPDVGRKSVIVSISDVKS